jgi:hypothetical protein
LRKMNIYINFNEIFLSENVCACCLPGDGCHISMWRDCQGEAQSLEIGWGISSFFQMLLHNLVVKFISLNNIKLILYRLGWQWVKLLNPAQFQSLGKSSALFWKTIFLSRLHLALVYKAIHSACICCNQRRIKMFWCKMQWKQS